MHGDTATTLAGALAGFHHGVPVVHVEAGLRSGELSSPFPEEGNRRLVGQVSALHLAPTPANRANLLCEGIPEETIVVTGNTVIDALRWAGDHAADYGRPELDDLDADPRRVVLASAHRRDAWPQLADIAAAFRRIADEPGTRVVVPLHRNPAVREAMLPVLAGHPNVTLTDPLPYLSFMKLLKRADLIVSDSSGAQEEGPALGKPTLVLSDVTERSEAVVAGTAKLVGKTTGASPPPPWSSCATGPRTTAWRAPPTRTGTAGRPCARSTASPASSASATGPRTSSRRRRSTSSPPNSPVSPATGSTPPAGLLKPRGPFPMSPTSPMSQTIQTNQALLTGAAPNAVRPLRLGTPHLPALLVENVDRYRVRGSAVVINPTPTRSRSTCRLRS